MEKQVTELGKSVFPIVILDIKILYDSLTDGLQNYIRNGKVYAALKQ